MNAVTVATTALTTLTVALAVAAALRSRPSRRAVEMQSLQPTSASAWRARLGRLRHRDDRVRPGALAEWADDLARMLRHGSSLHQALTSAVANDAVIAARTDGLRHRLERGTTVAAACDEWAGELITAREPRRRRSRPTHGTHLLVTLAGVIGAAAALGGAAAAPLDRFAVTMRQRASAEREREAQSAQATMSARVLTAVPLVVLALLLATDPDVRSVISSVTGGAAVALGLALNALGGVWMRRLIHNSGHGATC